MNHGGIAYISQNSIRLSEDLLRPLSIVEGSHVYLVYYPTPETESHQGAERLHDFMVTPVPPRAWPKAAGIRIDIKHTPGTLAQITELLVKKHANILMAQCTRSGHLHATWNMVVELEDIVPEPSSPESFDELVRKVGHKAEELESAILEKCEEYLSISNIRDSPYIRKPVSAWPLRALAYFNKVASTEHHSAPFEALCTGRDELTIPDALPIKVKGALPTLGFASLDTDSFNIRIAVLEKDRLPRFRSVSIEFDLEKSKETSSRGIISSIANELKGEWNLWRVYNQTQMDTPRREKGVIRLFLESRGTNLEERDLNERLTARIGAASRFIENLELSPVEINPLSPRRIFISIRSEKNFPRRGEVVEMCRRAASNFGILPRDVMTVETYTVSSVTDSVSDTIRSCTGMLQFYMGDSQDPEMNWLNAEFFLTCFLKIPSVRIVSPPLLNRLVFQRDHPSIPLSENSSREDFERVIREALLELNQRMNERL